MEQLIFSNKGTTETLPFVVTFSDRLQYGEVVNGAACSIIVLSGIDPNSAAMLVGAATYTTTTVTQNITAGVAGVTYMIVFAVTASGTHNYVKEGVLAVIAPGTL